jgi:hypothetical protein
VIVPSVPEKHSVADYASKPGKAKEDVKIISKRKVLLERFLNYVAVHPELGSAHFFHLFLSGEKSWGDVLTSHGLLHAVKKKESILSATERAALKRPGM